MGTSTLQDQSQETLLPTAKNSSRLKIEDLSRSYGMQTQIDEGISYLTSLRVTRILPVRAYYTCFANAVDIVQKNGGLSSKIYSE